MNWWPTTNCVSNIFQQSTRNNNWLNLVQMTRKTMTRKTRITTFAHALTRVHNFAAQTKVEFEFCVWFGPGNNPFCIRNLLEMVIEAFPGALWFEKALLHTSCNHKARGNAYIGISNKFRIQKGRWRYEMEKRIENSNINPGLNLVQMTRQIRIATFAHALTRVHNFPAQTKVAFESCVWLWPGNNPPCVNILLGMMIEAFAEALWFEKALLHSCCNRKAPGNV